MLIVGSIFELTNSNHPEFNRVIFVLLPDEYLACGQFL